MASAALASTLALAACGAASSAPAGASPQPVSNRLRTVLSSAWAGYKQVFIQPDGRVVDPTRGGVTTSEGQSYALLRAVWMGDRTTFNSVWSWTATHLQLGGDAPFASLWSDGRVVNGDSASNANSDIALALLYAAKRFGEAQLRRQAHVVLSAVWQDDVVSIDGINVLTGGNWATRQQQPGPVINPSYFAPYAYRTFAAEDPSHQVVVSHRQLVRVARRLQHRHARRDRGGESASQLVRHLAKHRTDRVVPHDRER